MMMHYYSFNIGDYKSHTSHLDPLEDIAYRRMLDWLYLHEKPLPEEVKQVARLIDMRTHSECIAIVLQEFFERTADGYINKRVSLEIDAFHAKGDKARASARARWDKVKSMKRKGDDADALQTQSEGNANHKPRTKNHKPITNINSTVKPTASPDVVGVFVCWQETMNHPRAKLDKKRERLIKDALKMGYSVDDLKRAVLGCSYSKWHMGENDRKKRFDSIDLIFRSADKIDGFIAQQPEAKNTDFLDGWDGAAFGTAADNVIEGEVI